MPTTSNFGWTTPADTDLVKNGALAIRTLGNGIDTSLLDLKGGTTGQILSKASNTDLDYTWINNDQGDITEVQAGTGISVASGTGPIPVVTNTVATAFDAKGDLIGGTGADTFSRLAVGTNGQVLTADSTTATGLKWATTSSGALALITAQAIGTGVSSVTVSGAFSSTYDSYRIILSDCVSSVASGNAIKITLGSTTTAYYYAGVFTSYNSTVSGLGGSNVGFWLAGSLDNGPSNLAMDIYQPNIAKPTYFTANNTFITSRGGGVWGCQNSNTSFTAFTLTPESGTFTGGTVYVYGYAKA